MGDEIVQLLICNTFWQFHNVEMHTQYICSPHFFSAKVPVNIMIFLYFKSIIKLNGMSMLTV